MKPQCKRHPKGTYYQNTFVINGDDDICDWKEIKLFKQMNNQALKAVCTCGWVANTLSSTGKDALVIYYTKHLQHGLENANIYATVDFALLCND